MKGGDTQSKILEIVTTTQDRVSDLRVEMAKNTVITQGHTEKIGELVHKIDAQSSKLLEIDNRTMGIDSWKNGVMNMVTKYYEEMLSRDGMSTKRLNILEDDYKSIIAGEKVNLIKVETTSKIKLGIWTTVGAIATLLINKLIEIIGKTQ